MRDSGFIDHWNGTYLTSNTVWAATGEPMGNRYAYLQAGRFRLLTFGFLYNFTGHCAAVSVLSVQETVRQEWFRHVLLASDDADANDSHSPHHYDAILVLAHMDCQDELITTVLLPAIRALVSADVPVQFIAGHSHRRCFVQQLNNDTAAASMEAGHYLDTVGFASFNITTRRSSSNSTATPPLESSFRYAFLDATRDSLERALGIGPPVSDTAATTRFDTSEGLALTKLIQSTRRRLGLDDIVGCNSNKEPYYLDREIADPQSLWRLYLERVVPTAIKTLSTTGKDAVFVQSTGGLRYDLSPGCIRRDDLIAVSPFNDTVCTICQGLTVSTIRSILKVLQINYSSRGKNRTLPPFASSLVVDAAPPPIMGTNHHHQRRLFDLIGIEFDIPAIAWAATQVGHNCSASSFPSHSNKNCSSNKNNKAHPACYSFTTTTMWLNYYATQSTSQCKASCTTAATTTKQQQQRLHAPLALVAPMIVETSSMLPLEVGRPLPVLMTIALLVCAVLWLRRRRRQRQSSSLAPTTAFCSQIVNPLLSGHVDITYGSIA